MAGFSEALEAEFLVLLDAADEGDRANFTRQRDEFIDEFCAFFGTEASVLLDKGRMNMPRPMVPGMDARELAKKRFHDVRSLSTSLTIMEPEQARITMLAGDLQKILQPIDALYRQNVPSVSESPNLAAFIHPEPMDPNDHKRQQTQSRADNYPYDRKVSYGQPIGTAIGGDAYHRPSDLHPPQARRKRPRDVIPMTQRGTAWEQLEAMAEAAPPKPTAPKNPKRDRGRTDLPDWWRDAHTLLDVIIDQAQFGNAESWMPLFEELSSILWAGDCRQLPVDQFRWDQSPFKDFSVRAHSQLDATLHDARKFGTRPDVTNLMLHLKTGEGGMAQGMRHTYKPFSPAAETYEPGPQASDAAFFGYGDRGRLGDGVDPHELDMDAARSDFRDSFLDTLPQTQSMDAKDLFTLLAQLDPDFAAELFAPDDDSEMSDIYVDWGQRNAGPLFDEEEPNEDQPA